MVEEISPQKPRERTNFGTKKGPNWAAKQFRSNSRYRIVLPENSEKKHFLVDVSDLFYFFFAAWGGGRGSQRCQEWGGRFLLEIPGGGGGLSPRRGRGRGAGRVSAANWGFWGGRGGGGLRGANYFFSEPKCPPRFHYRDRSVECWQRISHYRYRFSLEF